MKEIIWPLKGSTVLKMHVHPKCGEFLLKWVREQGIFEAAKEKEKWSVEHAEKRKPIGVARGDANDYQD